MIKGLFCKDSRMLVRNGQSLIDQNKFYSVHMGTLEPEAKNSYVLDAQSDIRSFPDMTGTYSVTISLDWLADIISGFSTVGAMDVYCRAQQVTNRGDNIGEAILISVNNQTIGCPYVVLQTSNGFYQKVSLFAGQATNLILSDGRRIRVARLMGTDVKKWVVDIDV